MGQAKMVASVTAQAAMRKSVTGASKFIASKRCNGELWLRQAVKGACVDGSDCKGGLGG